MAKQADGDGGDGGADGAARHKRKVWARKERRKAKSRGPNRMRSCTINRHPAWPLAKTKAFRRTGRPKAPRTPNPAMRTRPAPPGPIMVMVMAMATRAAAAGAVGVAVGAIAARKMTPG